MTAAANLSAHEAPDQFQFCSSLADDAWHGLDAPNAYEWWYFDAVSDDGRDAIVIIFLDNFIFSPRYNSPSSVVSRQSQKPKTTDDGRLTTDKFPAITFCYYRDGKPLYRGINEVAPAEFSARADFPSCRIGESDFSFEATPYGVRYILNIDVVLRGGKKLRAALEWLVVEHDYSPLKCPVNASSHFWNLASPRSDVTGKIEVFDRADKDLDLIQFRGTGYHDHNFDTRWLPATVAEWQWGRAHFADATAVYYRYVEIGAREPITKLFLIKDNKLTVQNATFAASERRRHYFGVSYPRTVDFLTSQDQMLTAKQSEVIDASFFYLRFLSEFTLDLGDGKKRQTTGISEHLAPKALHFRWLDWLVNMRISRNGRGAFLP
jgi:carotenoid 1,2-hydratase